jgi:SNF2 family DNA or RNA helicase
VNQPIIELSKPDNLPLYLAEPTVTGRSNGTVQWDEATQQYILRAAPQVLQFAKRVFPGCTATKRMNLLQEIRFAGTRRMVGELNWLLLRYPMEIACPERFGADREKAIQHALRREEKQTLAPVATPAGFSGTLYPYQAEGVAYLAANERALLADAMGLGKTVTALAALAHVGAWPVVVVCPPNVLRQWERMSAAFLSPAPTVYISRGLTPPKELPNASLYLIHYGLLAAWKSTLLGADPRAVVFDEVQELRNTGTMKYTAASYLAGEVQYCWGLSGTPIYNYGAEMWSVLNILDYHCLGDFDSFSREWCDGYGKQRVRQPEVLGEYLRREGLMIRRRKEDVQTQLPPKRRVVWTVDHDEACYDRLAATAKDLAGRYADIRNWQEKGQTGRLIETYARLATGVSKAPYVAAFVRGLVEAGERPLVYAWHHDVHDTISEYLQVTAARLTGKETETQKEEARRRFIAGDAAVLQLSLRTAAGLDGLQEAGTCVVFAELDWSPAIHAQCEDRLHRIGATAESILCYYCVAATGTDETIQDALGIKVGQFVGLMGDHAESHEDRMLAQRAATEHLGRIIERLQQAA